MTEANIGFMVASPVLELSEGARTITLEFNINNDFANNPFAPGELAGNFNIAVTGSKDWIAVPNITGFDIATDNAIKIDSGSAKIYFKFLLDESNDPVVNFDPSNS